MSDHVCLDTLIWQRSALDGQVHAWPDPDPAAVEWTAICGEVVARRHIAESGDDRAPKHLTCQVKLGELLANQLGASVHRIDSY